MTKEEMVSELKAYMHHIFYAQECLTVQDTIRKLKSEYLDEMNLAPAFFQLTVYTMFRTAYLEVAKLYRGSSDERTIWKLINIVNANINLFPKKTTIPNLCENAIELRPITIKINIVEYNKKFNEKINQYENEIKCLSQARDHFLAHNDPIAFYSGLDQRWEPGLDTEKLNELIGIIAEYCNYLLSALTGEIMSHHSLNGDDIKILLKELKTKRDTNKELSSAFATSVQF